jgi:hypothetical protein
MAMREASFEFLKWQESYDQQKPYEVLLPPASFGEHSKVPRSNLVFEPQVIPVQDIRGQQDIFDLDTHGFQVVKNLTAVKNLKDRAAAIEQYVPEMQRLLQAHLGGNGKQVRTRCFDLRVCETGPDTRPFA